MALPRKRVLSLWLSLVALGLAFGLVGAALFMTRMPGRSHRGALPPPSTLELDRARRLEAHVRVLAEEIGPRHAERPEALEAAASYIERELSAAGLEPMRRPFRAGPHHFVNVEAELPGRTRPEEIVVVGAHYDSWRGTPGANDNGSGVAVLLELARAHAAAPFERSLRWIAFAAEEPPHFGSADMGSAHAARDSAEKGERIVAMLSLETLGYYRSEPGSQAYPFPFGLFYPSRGDFVAFVGDLGSRALVRRAVSAFRASTPFPCEGGALPRSLPGVGWSDQRSYWQEGFSALMVTDTAPFRYPHYHRPSDLPSELDYTALARVTTGLSRVLAELAGE